MPSVSRFFGIVIYWILAREGRPLIDIEPLD